MLPDAVRTLYAFGVWANNRLLEAAGRLSPAQLNASDGGGYGSIRDTLVHIAATEWLYLERWQGRSPTEAWDPSEFPDITPIRTQWAEDGAVTHRFLADLTDANLGDVVAYVYLQGETWAYPLWQQVLHQSHHATQHRSEVAALLTQYGHSPGWLDFLVYRDEQNALTDD